MLNAKREKVGSMIFGFEKVQDMLMAYDTSFFDNGSVYETAEFAFNLKESKLQSEHTSMSTPNVDLDVNLTFEDSLVKGKIEVNRKNGENNVHTINDKYDYSVVRGEIYMLIHTLNLQNGDTIDLKALVTNSMSISNAKLYFLEEETITTDLGKFACDVMFLETDGQMPNNKIWVSKGPKRTIVKFHVPAAQLDIELVSQRPLIK